LRDLNRLCINPPSYQSPRNTSLSDIEIAAPFVDRLQEVPMAKARKKRKSYTPQERATILAAANRDRLTAAQVQRKFGVTPVTYYSWRKKTGVTRRRGVSLAAARSVASGGNLSSQVRLEVAQRVRQILPDIVRSEVSTYLNTLFASGPGRRRGHRL